jgi:D-alanyl-D-alanine carboxypeptidase (penicillin-binding protein 5/6)
MKKILAALAASVLTLTTAVAQTMPAPTVAARSYLLLDATSGQVLAAQEPDLRIEPASLTKIMTAYLVFKAIEDKKLTLDQMVNVSGKAGIVSGDCSKLFIVPATPVSV